MCSSDLWSAQRILGHVAYLAEANDVFFHQMATMTDPVRRAFPSGYDAPEMDALPVAVLLQRIEAALASSVELLSRTPDAAWGRPGYVRGMRRSLRQMVAYHAAHFDEHLAEIRRLLAT